MKVYMCLYKHNEEYQNFGLVLILLNQILNINTIFIISILIKMLEIVMAKLQFCKIRKLHLLKI